MTPLEKATQLLREVFPDLTKVSTEATTVEQIQSTGNKVPAYRIQKINHMIEQVAQGLITAGDVELATELLTTHHTPAETKSQDVLESMRSRANKFKE